VEPLVQAGRLSGHCTRALGNQGGNIVGGNIIEI
jgi:hypothetical protein